MKLWCVKEKKSCSVIGGLKTSFLYEVCWNATYFPFSNASSIPRYLHPTHGASLLLPGSTGTTCTRRNTQKQSSTKKQCGYVLLLSWSNWQRSNRNWNNEEHNTKDEPVAGLEHRNSNILCGITFISLLWWKRQPHFLSLIWVWTCPCFGEERVYDWCACKKINLEVKNTNIEKQLKYNRPVHSPLGILIWWF